MEIINKIFSNPVEFIFVISGLILVKYLAQYTSRKILEHDEKVAKVQLEKLDSAMVQLEEIVAVTVRSLNQEKVNELKEKGNFTESRQKEILEEAVNRIKKNLNKNSLNILNIAIDHIDCFIKDIIHATIDEMKNNGN
jgi:uncharacterized protein (UPF0212 family)